MSATDRKDPFREGPAAAAARRRRSLAIALGLLLFIALIFAVTMVNMSRNTQARLSAPAEGAARR
jgi:hypothetical protein